SSRRRHTRWPRDWSSDVCSAYLAYIGEHGTPINFGVCSNCDVRNNNSTIWSINALTGEVNWHHFIPIQGYRGGVSTSGNLVFATLSSGDMLMINAATGELVRHYYVDAPMNVTASFGASIDGR